MTYLECPACGDNVEIENDSEHPMDAEPATTDDLGPSETRLLELCDTYATPDIRRELLHLFGWPTCEWCHARFRMADGLA